MTQVRSRRKRPESSSQDANTSRSSLKAGYQRSKTLRECLRQEDNPYRSDKTSSSSAHSLTSLIERDAPLQDHSVLVLMYGPFQAEMLPQAGKGVASWLKDCVRQHGIPSLVRFDYRRRAQIYRRDQFQPWLEPLLTGLPV
jgi:hypothetical protein